MIVELFEYVLGFLHMLDFKANTQRFEIAHQVVTILGKHAHVFIFKIMLS